MVPTKLKSGGGRVPPRPPPIYARGMHDGQEPSVLDLIFSNEEGMVKNLEVHAALGKSDHAVLTLDFQCSWSQDNTDTLKYMYGKGDYEKLRKIMPGTDWEEQLEGKTVEQAWTTVRSQLDAAVASCIPKKTTRPGDARSKRLWNTSVFFFSSGCSRHLGSPLWLLIVSFQ